MCHTIVELEKIPWGLRDQPSVREIYEEFKKSFVNLVDLPTADEARVLPKDVIPDLLVEFKEILSNILERHANVNFMMGMGIFELKESGFDDNKLNQLTRFLDRFYMSRIGIRTQMQQHITTFSGVKKEGWVGVFEIQCDLKRIIEEAVDYASSLCRHHYCDAPPVNIHVPLGDSTMVYIPSHIHYMLSEILKNSFRAVLEFHGEDKVQYPPIEINIYMKDKEVVIKISDLGGGLPQTLQKRLFSYSFSTASRPNVARLRAGDNPFAGFGYGLALSRLHARYLGGDMFVRPVYGYGTDVYIHLNNFHHAFEVLPSLDRAVLRIYEKGGDAPTNWMEIENQLNHNLTVKPIIKD